MTKKEKPIKLGVFILRNGNRIIIHDSSTILVHGGIYRVPLSNLTIMLQEKSRGIVCTYRYPATRLQSNFIKNGYFNNYNTQLTTLGDLSHTKIKVDDNLNGLVLRREDIKRFSISISGNSLTPTVSIEIK